MRNRKQKISNRVTSLILAILMFVSIIPTDVAANPQAQNDPAYDYLEVQNLKGQYVYTSESEKAIELTWDTIDGEVDTVSVAVGEEEPAALADKTKTTYNYDASSDEAGKKIEFKVSAVKGEEERTATVNVTVPYILEGIGTIADVDVANDVSVAEIKDALPTSVKVTASGAQKEAQVVWSADAIENKYEKDATTEKSFVLTGKVVLPDNIINPENKDLSSVEVTVKVAAAESASITKDLEYTPPAGGLKVDGSLDLSVAATGTGVTYQWYKDGAPIASATASSYAVNKVALADAGEYYCEVKGKDNSLVTSKKVVVEVKRLDTSVELKITPKEGQTRPLVIELEAIGLPEDAKGTVTFYEGTSVIPNGEMTLPKNKVTFKAYGPEDTFTFTVKYEVAEDDDRYIGSEDSFIEYNFEKGIQKITKVDGIPTAPEELEALDSFTITPTTTLDPLSDKVVEYEYASTNEAVATVTDEGLVELKTKGEFKIVVTAVSDDDYNGDVFETTTIQVGFAKNDDTKLSFDQDLVEVAYEEGFLHNVAEQTFTDTSFGDGSYTYSVVSKPSEKIIFESSTGIINYNVANPKDENLTETLVGDVIIKLTKTDKNNVYAPVEATYTLRISKGTQAELQFDKTEVTVQYVENEAGIAQTTDVNVVTGGTVESAIVYATEDTDIITLNTSDGSFIAEKPGTATVTVTKVGNSLYEDCTPISYVVTVEKGDVEGFVYDDTLPETEYGVQFTKVAAGGQQHSTGAISYAIDWDNTSEELKSNETTYVSVDSQGVVSFQNNWEKAADKDSYTVRVIATKASDAYYNGISTYYDLTVNRKNINLQEDILVNGEPLKDEWYNLEDVKDHDNRVTVTPANGYNWIKQENGAWAQEVVLDSDDVHEFKFYLKKCAATDSSDAAIFSGATTKLSSETVVKFDKTPAKAKLTLDEENFWDAFLSKIGFDKDRWQDGARTIQVETSDEVVGIETSGVAKVEYYEQNSDAEGNNFDAYDVDSLINDSNIEWKDVEDNEIPIQLEDNRNKKVVVYVRVTDNAGNVSYFCTDGIGFDNVTPEPEVALTETPIVQIEVRGTEKGLYNGEVPFSLVVTDPQTNGVTSGIKEITVAILGSEYEEFEKVIHILTDESEIGIFNSDEIDAAFEVDNTFVIPSDFSSNYLTIRVEMKDFAGNIYNEEKTIVEEELAIDTIQPEIKVSYDDDEDTFSSGHYIGNNKNRVATIDITELNFVNDAVDIIVTRDGQPVTITPNFAPTGLTDVNGDNIGWQMQIIYDEDGDYTFDIAYTDKAGNPNKDVDYGDYLNPQAFTIDNTKPVVTVTYDNNSVRNGNYYKEDRVATIKFVEHNFDAERVTIIGTASDDGKPTSFPKASAWSSNGDVHTATIAYRADSKYSFDIEALDKADNSMEDYTLEEFYIDKTNPSISIKGVVDESANNTDDIGYVITATDTNFDEATPVLTAVVLGENGFETKTLSAGQEAAVKNGRTYTLKNIEKDGVYSITCTLVDKAGNEFQEVTLYDANGKAYVVPRSGEDTLIRFSVNRDGSTFLLGDYTQQVVDNFYVQNVSEDITIIEINTDEIKESAVTLNGETLEEDADYTVSLSTSQGGWHQYTYSAKETLFEKEGEYNLIVSSTDKAENDAFSDVKGASVKYVVDQTAPVITVTGMAANGRYQTEEQTVTIIPTDDGGALKSLLVRTVDDDGEEITELMNLTGEDLENALLEDNGKLQFPIAEGLYQNVQIVCNDYAVDEEGNTNTYDETFTNVSVSSSAIMIFWANKPLRWSSISVLAVLGIVAIGVIIYKKKKEN